MWMRASLGALVLGGLGGQIIRHPDSWISAVAVRAPDMHGLRYMHGHVVRSGVTALAPGRLGVNFCLALAQAQRLTLAILFLRRTRRLLHGRCTGTRLDHAVQRDYERGCEDSHQVTLASQSHSHLLAPSSELQTQIRKRRDEYPGVINISQSQVRHQRRNASGQHNILSQWGP